MCPTKPTAVAKYAIKGETNRNNTERNSINRVENDRKSKHNWFTDIEDT